LFGRDESLPDTVTDIIVVFVVVVVSDGDVADEV